MWPWALIKAFSKLVINPLWRGFNQLLIVKNIDIFKSWDGYSMACPNFDETLDDFTLSGDTESMIT